MFASLEVINMAWCITGTLRDFPSRRATHALAVVRFFQTDGEMKKASAKVSVWCSYVLAALSVNSLLQAGRDAQRAEPDVLAPTLLHRLSQQGFVKTIEPR
jgi:hypothetical protein